MTEKELKELEKFAKENGYNDELKDIYLKHICFYMYKTT